VIISRTPFRVSFFGGGTDFPEWFENNGGAVLSTTINHYCYLTCRKLPHFFDHKHRIVYSKTETVSSIDDIQHPAVREALRHLQIPFGVEIHHAGDLPASSGIGSSSAFAVGLLMVLRHLIHSPLTRMELAREAILLERELLQESVGLQDQIACAFGGVNYIEFNRDSSIDVIKLLLTDTMQEEIAERMILVYSGQSRLSGSISEAFVDGIASNKRSLGALQELAPRGRAIFEQKKDLDEIGDLLDQAFHIKAKVNPLSVTSEIAGLYQFGRSKGALGGKVLGAGGGGFMMFWVKAGDRERFVASLSGRVVVPARIEHEGSVILFTDEKDDSTNVDFR